MALPYSLEWFKVNDNHSGGGLNGSHEAYYFEAPDEETARLLFEEYTGRSLYEVACDCCGPSFSFYSVDAGDVPHPKNTRNELVVFWSDVVQDR